MLYLVSVAIFVILCVILCVDLVLLSRVVNRYAQAVELAVLFESVVAVVSTVLVLESFF